MKKSLLFILLNASIVLQIGCTANRFFFHNKILVYSSEPEFGKKTSNAGFIDFYKDTINKIDYPFDLFENEKKSAKLNRPEDSLSQRYILPNIYPHSGVPFQFSRSEKSIYISYTFKGEAFKKEYFRISKIDSVETSTFDYLCDTDISDNWVVTRFTKDTVMKICNKRIKCWVFKEEYPHLFSPNLRAQVIYLDKKSLLPVQINTIFYRPDRKNPSIVDVEVFKSKINTIFNRPWSSSDKKWNYSKCWRSGYSSMEGNH